MRKILVALLSMLTIGCATVGITACEGVTSGITVDKSLDVPKGLRIENGCLWWNPVEYASKYTVSIDGKEYYAEDYQYVLEDIRDGKHSFKVKANGDGIVYISSGWSEEYVVEIKDKAISREYAYKDFVNLAENESYLGYGFDVINSAQFSDKYVKTSFPIFNTDSLMQQRLVKVDSRQTHVEEIKSSSMEEYMKQWNVNLNVNVGWDSLFNAGSVDIDLKYTGGVENARSKYFHSISFYNQEFYIVMQSDMKTYRSILSEGFLNDLYSDMSPAALFDRYGTHFITSAVMGGRIDSHYLYTSEEEKRYHDISGAVSVNVRGWASNTNVDVSGGYRQQASEENIDIKNTLDVIGGDNFGMMQDTDIAGNYLSWQKSLAQNAALMGIKDTGSLIPLWELIDAEKDTKTYTYTNLDGVQVVGSRAQQLQTYFEKYGLQAYNMLLSNAKLPEIVMPTSIENICVNNQYSDTGEYEVYAGMSNLITFEVMPETAIGYTKNASLSKESAYAKIDNENGLSLIIEANCPHNTVLNIVVGAGGVRKTISVRVVRRYIVTFESNGGTEIAPYYNVRSDTQIDAPTPPKKEGKVFDGWYTTPNFSEGTKYLFGKSAIVDNLTLYAKWKDKDELKGYIEYNWNEGAPVGMEYTQEYQEGDKIILPAAERGGYTFEGWYVDRVCETPVDISDLENNPRDIQLYALWLEDQYAFSYSYNASANSYTVTGIGYVEDRDIEIPSHYKGIPVTTIAKNAFANNTNLVSVVIGDSVTKIEAGAFNGCSNLIRVVLGKAVKDIYTPIGMVDFLFMSFTAPFGRCIRLIEVCNKSDVILKSSMFSYGNATYCDREVYTNENESKIVRTNDGFIKYIDGSVVELIGYIGEETDVVIPSDVTHLSVSFSGNKNIRSVKLGKNVVFVGENAFNHCKAISRFYIDSANTAFSVIDDDLYSKDGKTLVKYAIGKLDASFTVPNTVTSIQGNAFAYGEYLETLKTTKVEMIGDYAFSYCKNLKNVTLNYPIMTIGCNAFLGCSELSSVTFKASTSWMLMFGFYVSTSEDFAEKQTVPIKDPVKNAEYFRETYCNYYWRWGE